MELHQLKQVLNESGIRIPESINAARIVHHEDFDGIFSAIITFQQLKKQGIPKENITIVGIQYGDTNEEFERKLSRSKGQMVALVDFARLPKGSHLPDFWSDHHKADKQYGLSSGRTGAFEFKSEAHHLALNHTINMVDSKTMEVIDKIDSAGYTNLEEVLTLPKKFKKARRLERLGILCNALLSKSGIVDNISLLDSFVKKTQPSIVSFYNNILEYVRLNAMQELAIKELRKNNPDWEIIEKARNYMPTAQARNKIQPGAKMDENVIDDYEELQTLRGKKRNKKDEFRYKQLINKDIVDMRYKRAGSINKAIYNNDFEQRGSTLIQHNTRLQRYIWTQMNKDGIKFPFIIKRFATFIQIAINPELPKRIKNDIDLGIVAKDVMRIVRDKFETKYNSWAFKIINSEMGGHKGITNIPALGTIGLMKKADREELKYLESLETRVKKLKMSNRHLNDEDQVKLDKALMMLKDKSLNSATETYYKELVKLLSSPMRKLMPDKMDKLISLRDKKKEAAKFRVEIMDEIIEEFINQFEIQFGASKDKASISGKEIKGGKGKYAFIDKARDELS